MSERHYLIRRNLESFIGPMTVRDMRQSFKRMEFGLQDEVAAGFREWVAFDDVEKMKRIYPELVDLVRRDMLNGWGMGGEDEDTRIIKAGGSRPNAGGSKRGVPSKAAPQRNLNKALIVLIVIGTAALAAFFFARHGEFASKFLAGKDPQVSVARDFYNAKDDIRYESYLERYQKDILTEMQTKKGLESWLPHMRLLAFRREGKLDGMNVKYFRGADVSADIPKDCSKGMWAKLWKKEQAQWPAFVEGKEAPKSDWSRLLLWDPNWIKRRSYQSSWIEPRSFYEGCLSMARKALQETYQSDADKPRYYEDILARLEWQLSLVKGSQGASEITMSGTLWALSCFESAAAPANLDECQSSVQDISKEWDGYLKQRMALQQVHLLTLVGPTMAPGDLDAFKKAMTVFKPKDPWTKFGYEPEAKFYQAIMATGGKISDAQAQAYDKATGIKFPE